MPNLYYKFDLEGAEFRFIPYIYFGKNLEKPVKKEVEEKFLAYVFPSGKLKLGCKRLNNIIHIYGIGNLKCEGKICECILNIPNFSRMLVYHFTYTPPNYFKTDKKEFDYPAFKETGEGYSAWSYPIHLNKLGNLKSKLKISQILFERNGVYYFLLPFTCNSYRGVLENFENGFKVVLETSAKWEGNRVDFLVVSWSKDPYKAVELAYEYVAKNLFKEQILRKNKVFPKVFEYLGWCSWNAFWKKVNSSGVLSFIEDSIRKGLKIGFVLVDDGWQQLKENMLLSFEPDPIKFPRGFKQFVKDVKERGVKFVGLWYTLNFYWRGIDSESELANKFREYLVKGRWGMVPKPHEAFKIYNEFHNLLRKWGFDFIKVDNQSCIGFEYGNMCIEEAAEKLHEGLEGSAFINNLEILNCMAQQPENVFNWFKSSVSRNCVDYIVPHVKSRDKLHLYFNAYNALWMSQVVWPDWDMFQSHDPWALQQAVARAVSGGPVYITDEPGKTRVEIVRPLAFTDGRLPRPDQPALPTQDILLRDPYNEPIPLKIFTKAIVKGLEYGIVATFNIYKEDKVIEFTVSPKDAQLASSNYIAYEYFSGKVYTKFPAKFKLEPMSVKLFIFAPSNRWLTPIGLKEVYIMPRKIYWHLYSHAFGSIQYRCSYRFLPGNNGRCQMLSF